MMMANASGRGDLDAVRLTAARPRPICTACAAGTHALTYAARLIAWDMADAVVTGGSEHAGTVTAHRRLRRT